jgi:hypothetical protein
MLKPEIREVVNYVDTDEGFKTQYPYQVVALINGTIYRLRPMFLFPPPKNFNQNSDSFE